IQLKEYLSCEEPRACPGGPTIHHFSIFQSLMQSSGKKIKLLLKLIITVLFLSIVFRNYFDLEKLEILLRTTNYFFIIILLFISFCHRYVNAIQINICLKPFSVICKVKDAFKIQLISTFYAFVLPGEIASLTVSWYLFSKKSGKRAQVASVLIFIKIIYFLTLIPFVCFAIYFEPRLSYYKVSFPLIIFSVILLNILFAFFIRPVTVFYEIITLWIIDKFKISRISQALSNFWKAVYTFQEHPTLFIFSTVFISFLLHLLYFLWFLISIYSLNISVPFFVCFWLIPLLVFIRMLPLTFAGTGARELSFVIILKWYGVTSEQALLFSILILLFAIIQAGCGAYLNLRMKNLSRL
ncbi:YbhN family protein, partial [Chlamydiota bacterium]